MSLIILQLIASHGIPLAARIYGIVTTHFAANNAPTPKLWADLAAAENESNESFVKALKV